MSTIEATHGWLQSTLSADQTQRRAAEEALKQSEFAAEHVVHLFRIAADTSVAVDVALRQAAAIRMKTVISRGWDSAHSSADGKAVLSAADKAAVRDNLVEAMVVAVPVVRTQLGLCLRSIAQVDYPGNWPGLLPAICANMQQQNTERVYGALFALRMLVKVYEFRKEAERAPLHAAVEHSWPLMAQLVEMLIGTPSVEGAELALLAMKVFWSATQISLPPLLLRAEQLAVWMRLLIGLLEQPLPPGAPEDFEAAEAWRPWKVKKRVAQIVHRLLQRYGDPKRKRDGPGAKEALAFAQHFHDEWMTVCQRSCLGVLSLRANGTACPDRVVTLCLNYLEEGVRYKRAWSDLKPQLAPLFLGVLFPLLCFTERDQKQWDEDPVEYVRKEFDVIEDFYNPRTAATSVVIDLARARGKEALPIFVGHCSTMLNEALNATQMALLAQKGGALLCLGALHDRLHKKAEYADKLEGMLYMHVLPELQSKAGFMRARAVWVFGQFAKSVFANGGATQPAQFQEVFNRAMALLGDPELPVRVQAALAINGFVEANCAPEAVLAVLPRLVDALFKLMNDIGNEEVVQTLDNLIERYGEQMAPYAVQIVGALAQNFLRLFEEQEDDEDDDALAAMWVLQAISTMMEAVSEKPEVYVQMEAALMPLLHKMMGESAREYFEDVNEVLSYLTYYSPAISDELWTIFPRLHEAFHTWAFEYVNNMLVPIDNFISRATERFITGGAMVGDEATPYLAMVMSICRATLTTHAQNLPDQEQHGACKLLESLLHNCHGRIDAQVPEVLSLALMRLEALLAAEEGRRKDGSVHSMVTLLYNVLSSALHYNAALALQVLQHRHQAGWHATLHGWMQHLTTCPKLRLHDLKCGVLAVASLLALPPAQAPEIISRNPLMLVQSGMTLLQAMEGKRAADKSDEAAALGANAAAEDGEEYFLSLHSSVERYLH